MTPINFKRYGPNGADKTVVAERITHWEQIPYNGNYGTCIFLDTGKEVHVGEWPQDVEKKITQALKKEGQT